MVKKKKSLQSIFVPSFFRDNSHPPSSSVFTLSPDNDSPGTPSSSRPQYVRKRSHTHSSGGAAQIYSALLPSVPPVPSPMNLSPSPSSASTPGRLSPSSYFFDDDPFANRTVRTTPAPPRVLRIEKSELSPPLPKESDTFQRPLPSPLNPHITISTTSLPRQPSTSAPLSPDLTVSDEFPTIPRPPLPHSASYNSAATGGSLSRASTLKRAAYNRPAFSQRPSLPSLSTLARMDMRVPQRKRTGKVGAGLPSEPWEESETSGQRSSRSSDEFGMSPLFIKSN